MDAGDKPKPNITLALSKIESSRRDPGGGGSSPSSQEKTITLLDDLLSFNCARECKRPDRGLLLQIIIGALHYLPNPRTHASADNT